MGDHRGWVPCGEDAPVVCDTRATVEALFGLEFAADDTAVREWFAQRRPPLAKSYADFVETPSGRAVLDFYQSLARRQ